MDVAYVSALSALGGSVVGGLISGTATWLAQRSQILAGRRSYQISHREELFRDFITAASSAISKAMMSSQPELQDLVAMYGAINRMRVLCLPRTVACAERVVEATLETYFEPNKSFHDILEMMKKGIGDNPLSDFAESAREELRTLAS
jgi:hypothetical protein